MDKYKFTEIKVFPKGDCGLSMKPNDDGSIDLKNVDAIQAILRCEGISIPARGGYGNYTKCMYTSPSKTLVVNLKEGDQISYKYNYELEDELRDMADTLLIQLIHKASTLLNERAKVESELSGCGKAGSWTTYNRPSSSPTTAGHFDGIKDIDF